MIKTLREVDIEAIYLNRPDMTNPQVASHSVVKS